MNGGHIQQAGTPLEVYGHPANRFVASFIGMPEMNIIEGRVLQRDTDIVFVADNIALPLPGELGERAKQGADQPLGLGVRPEHFSLANQVDSPTLHVQVQVIEMLGAMMDIFGLLPNGQRVLARIEAAPIEPNTTVPFKVAIEKAHLFEQGTYGKNLAQVTP